MLCASALVRLGDGLTWGLTQVAGVLNLFPWPGLVTGRGQSNSHLTFLILVWCMHVMFAVIRRGTPSMDVLLI